MGNPLVLDNRSTVDSAVADTVWCIGFYQYNAYVNKKLVNQTTPITICMGCVHA